MNHGDIMAAAGCQKCIAVHVGKFAGRAGRKLPCLKHEQCRVEFEASRKLSHSHIKKILVWNIDNNLHVLLPGLHDDKALPHLSHLPVSLQFQPDLHIFRFLNDALSNSWRLFHSLH